KRGARGRNKPHGRAGGGRFPRGVEATSPAPPRPAAALRRHDGGGEERLRPPPGGRVEEPGGDRRVEPGGSARTRADLPRGPRRAAGVSQRPRRLSPVAARRDAAGGRPLPAGRVL